MSSFSALQVAISGLKAAQLGIDTASHNITNAAVAGYTRRRVEPVSRLVGSLSSSQLEGGERIVEVIRAREVFLDNRFRTDSAAFGVAAVRAELLSEAAGVLRGLQAGLGADWSALWTSFDALAISPQDTEIRQDVVSRIRATVARVRSIAERLDALSSAGVSSMASTIEQANTLLCEVGALNRAVVAGDSDPGTAFDLKDRRDVLLDELSSRLGVRVIGLEDGSVRISLDGMELVGDGLTVELAFDSSRFSVLHPAEVELAVGGETSGFQSFLRDDLAVLVASFDVVVATCVDAVNSAHSAGWVSPTEKGGDLMTYDSTSPANTLDLAIVDPEALATAASTGAPFPAFDGSNADTLANLRAVPVAGNTTQTIEGAFRSVMAQLEQTAATANTRARTCAASLASSDRARMSTHGVCVEEEMVSMREYKRMYETAADVMAAIDAALDVVIEPTGVSGR